MNKKQVKAFLGIMGKDPARVALNVCKVDRFRDKTVLVATNAYVLTAVYIEGDASNILGKTFKRESFERWYKLAGGRDVLTVEDIEEMEEGLLDYPKWQNLINDKKENTSRIAFNADFVKLVQELNASENVTLELDGKLGGMTCDHEVSYSIIMPVKQ